MSPDLELTLIVFLCVAILVTFLVGLFLVIWLINLNKLTISLTESSELFRMELKPILEEAKFSLQKMNSILVSVSNKFGKINKVAVSIAGILGMFLGNFKNFSGGFLKGIFQGVSLFKKK